MFKLKWKWKSRVSNSVQLLYCFIWKRINRLSTNQFNGNKQQQLNSMVSQSKSKPKAIEGDPGCSSSTRKEERGKWSSAGQTGLRSEHHNSGVSLPHPSTASRSGTPSLKHKESVGHCLIWWVLRLPCTLCLWSNPRGSVKMLAWQCEHQSDTPAEITLLQAGLGERFWFLDGSSTNCDVDLYQGSGPRKPWSMF